MARNISPVSAGAHARAVPVGPVVRLVRRVARFGRHLRSEWRIRRDIAELRDSDGRRLVDPGIPPRDIEAAVRGRLGRSREIRR